MGMDVSATTAMALWLRNNGKVVVETTCYAVSICCCHHLSHYLQCASHKHAHSLNRCLPVLRAANMDFKGMPWIVIQSQLSCASSMLRLCGIDHDN